jgi:hypothetical protein
MNNSTKKINKLTRLVFLVLVSLSSTYTFGQVAVTDGLIDSFLQNNINDINLKIYKAAIEQRIPAYTSDSFKGRLTPDEIQLHFGYEYVDQVTHSDYPNDIIDTMVIVELNPQKDLKGLHVVYKQTTNANNGQITYTPMGVGSGYTIKPTGIEIDMDFLFLSKMSDLEPILTSNELSLVNAIISQNSQLGDFRVYQQRYYTIDSSNVAFQQALRSVQSKDDFIADNIDYRHKTKLLSGYNRHIASIIMSRIATNQEPKHRIDKTLFKDINLTKPYKHPASELAGELITAVEDEYGDLKDTVVLIWASFFEKYDYKVWKVADDYVFDFTIEQFGYTLDNGHIFMSFNSVKDLFPKQDRIVWDALLKDLFSQ